MGVTVFRVAEGEHVVAVAAISETQAADALPEGGEDAAPSAPPAEDGIDDTAD